MEIRNFSKFSDIEYARPDFEAYKREARAYIGELRGAGSYEEARALFLRDDEKSAEIGTMYQVAYIRSTCDTGDEFYRGEVEYIEEQLAYMNLVARDEAKAFLECPFLGDFAAEFGQDVVKSAEAQVRLSDESVVPDMIEESRLCNEYTRVAAGCKTVFRGEECNFYGLLRYMEDPDRAVRKEAYLKWAELYEGVSGQLDYIFVRLVKLRRGMAKKLGFDNYADMMYLKNSHYYYGADEVAAFRKEVVEHVVPVADRMYREQAETLGVDRLRYYDEPIKFPEGNPLPEGGEEELKAAAARMYGEMSPETGEFFSFMEKHDLFDLTTRPGKHLGGYCTFLDEYKAPFIFSNFNGTSADVDVLTHEAGHAFQAYEASRRHELSSLVWSTNEISEIHSMTMELFAYRYMDGFFGENAEKYERVHFADTVETVPYLCLVDHFQHRVYAEENLTGKKLAAIWKELEAVYMPWRDYDGVPFLENGGFWMQKQHIFLYPFYYIDYALAQMGAFELFTRSEKDWDEAWGDYLRLCKLGGSRSYFDTLRAANLSNPFEEGTVEHVMDGISPRFGFKDCYYSRGRVNP